MKKNVLKNMAVICSAAAVMSLLGGCTSSDADLASKTETENSEMADTEAEDNKGAEEAAAGEEMNDNNSDETVISGDSISKHIDLSAGEPTEADLAANPDFVHKEYIVPVNASNIWPDVKIGEVNFHGTVFGDTGYSEIDETVKENYTLEAAGENGVHLAVTGSKGKVADGSEGYAMYFYKIPANADFTLSATATVNSAEGNKQAAFGLVARDDMYIDVADKGILSDSVVAGTTLENNVNCYYRKGGKLNMGKGEVAALETGKPYQLKIEKNSDGYACTFGENKTQTGGFDFPLTGVDSKYQYVGMFAARDVDVTYTDVHLEVKGGIPADDVLPGEKDKSDKKTASEKNAEEKKMTSHLDEFEASKGNSEAAHTVYIVGDSTACGYISGEDGSYVDSTYYYPRYGYGTQLYNYLDGSYKIENLALSGRSSKSFLQEDNYEKLKSSIKEGDVLIIGFGHNDEKCETERYTNPNGDYTAEGSFAKSLYDNYVKIALDAKAEPVLCTPICRRNGTGVLTDANMHITTDNEVDGVKYEGGDYAQAIRNLAEVTGCKLVDLTNFTKDMYTEIGAEGTVKLHAWSSDSEASVDDTHLNIYGAKTIAYILAKELMR